MSVERPGPDDVRASAAAVAALLDAVPDGDDRWDRRAPRPASS